MQVIRMPDHFSETRGSQNRREQAVTFGFGLLGTDLRYLFSDPGLSVITGTAGRALVGSSMREVQPGWAKVLEPLCQAVFETGQPVPEVFIGPAVAMGGPARPLWKGCITGLQDSAGTIHAVTLLIEPINGVGRISSPIPVSAQEPNFIEVLAMLAHDYRNRLTPILSAAQMIGKYGAEKPNVLDWAAKSIERQVREMTNDLNDLIGLAQLILGKIQWQMHEFDLSQTIHRVGESSVDVAGKLDKHLNMSAELPRLRVFGDPARLEQALDRLYRHVLELAPSGGTVESSVRQDTGLVVIQIGQYEPCEEAGLDDWSIRPFLNPATFGGGKPSGVGPGIAFANQVICQHGGSVSRVDMGLEKGVALVVRVPTLEAGPDRAEGLEDASEPIP